MLITSSSSSAAIAVPMIARYELPIVGYQVHQLGIEIRKLPPIRACHRSIYTQRRIFRDQLSPHARDIARASLVGNGAARSQSLLRRMLSSCEVGQTWWPESRVWAAAPGRERSIFTQINDVDMGHHPTAIANRESRAYSCADRRRQPHDLSMARRNGRRPRSRSDASGRSSSRSDRVLFEPYRARRRDQTGRSDQSSGHAEVANDLIVAAGLPQRSDEVPSTGERENEMKRRLGHHRSSDRGTSDDISKIQASNSSSLRPQNAKKKGAPTCAGAPQRSGHCRVCAQTGVVDATPGGPRPGRTHIL